MKAREDNGGIVENIRFRDIKMKDVRYPIYISSYYPKVPAHPSQEAALPKGARVPIWRNVTIESLVAEGCRNSIILWGHPREPIQGVTLRNVKISAKTGALVWVRPTVEGHMGKKYDKAGNASDNGICRHDLGASKASSSIAPPRSGCRGFMPSSSNCPLHFVPN